MDAVKFELMVERMKVQMDLSWAKEQRWLELQGLKDGGSILEVGCGPGFITERLLEKYPTSRVTATDVNEDFIRYAQEYLNVETRDRIQVQQDNILESELPDNHFDFVLVRLVFQHVSDPLQAAREIHRVLKPGGKVFIVDVDDSIWGFMDPAVPELMHMMEKHTEEQKSEGGNRFIGRKLWGLLREVGFADIDVSGLLIHSDEMGLTAFVPQVDVEEMRTMVDSGFATEEDVNQVQEACQQFLNHDDAFVMLMLFAASGRKKFL